MHLQRPCFQIRSHSQVLAGRTWAYLSGGHNPAHDTGYYLMYVFSLITFFGKGREQRYHGGLNVLSLTAVENAGLESKLQGDRKGETSVVITGFIVKGSDIIAWNGKPRPCPNNEKEPSDSRDAATHSCLSIKQGNGPKLGQRQRCQPTPRLLAGPRED